MKRISKKQNANRVIGLEGCYIKVGQPAMRWLLVDGRYEWGSRMIHDFGSYTAEKPDEFSCIVYLASQLFRNVRKQCRITRRGKTYTVKELPDGEQHKFKRDDDMVFLAESPSGMWKQTGLATSGRQGLWKQIEVGDAKVNFDLTGESVLRAATIPAPPTSKGPTIVRVSHSNVYGRVDSDIFVRLGDPKKPLDVEDFDTVSDWRKSKLVEELLWSEEGDNWVVAANAKGATSVWCGTYDVGLLFPKGHHQIEIKIISRVPEVCSIVLSNWKVYIR